MMFTYELQMIFGILYIDDDDFVLILEMKKVKITLSKDLFF